MADLTSNLARVYSDEGARGPAPVAASTVIHEGMAVQANAAGQITPMADTTSAEFAGFALQKVDNADGAAGDYHCTILEECITEVTVVGSASSAPGTKVYASDSNTFDVSATTNTDPAGVLVRQVSGTTWKVRFVGRRRRFSA